MTREQTGRVFIYKNMLNLQTLMFIYVNLIKI
jgi:hypothetical protein